MVVTTTRPTRHTGDARSVPSVACDPQVTLTINVDDITAELKQGTRFVGWRHLRRRGEKPTKLPVSPAAPTGASSTDPDTWTTFEDALAYARTAGLAGVMRAFDGTDGMVGIDLDNCRDPGSGQLAEWAADIVARLDTYTEVSPSGRGVKAWVRATLPAHGRKRGDVEMYDRARFFALTGHHLAGTPRTVGRRPDAVLAIHREVFGDAPGPVATADPDRPIPALERGDEDVLRLASESRHSGAKFRRLWAGDTGEYVRGDNDGASEGDAALCSLLAFFGGPDPARIERLWLRSGLYRPKLDRADYRSRTIAFVLRGRTRFYGDDLHRPAGPTSDPAPAPDGAEVRRLQRALLDRDDLIEDQACIINRERAEKQAFRARLDGWKAVLSNPHLKPVDRIVAIPFIETVQAARQIDQDEVHVRYPGIVAGWGVPESTVQKSAGVLTQPDCAPLAKRTVTDRITWTDRETGLPVTATPSKVLVRAVDDGDLWAAFATYDPSLPARGGRQEPKPDPLPVCPDCAGADVIRRQVTQCGKCRRPIAPSKERRLRRQNEGVGDTPAPVSGTGISRRQNEGVGDQEATTAERRAVVMVAGRPDRPSGRTGSRAPRRRDGPAAPGQPHLTLVPPQPDRPQTKPAVWRCPAPLPDGRTCNSLERQDGPDGSWRCAGRGHVGRDPDPVLAVAGGGS